MVLRSSSWTEKLPRSPVFSHILRKRQAENPHDGPIPSPTTRAASLAIRPIPRLVLRPPPLQQGFELKLVGLRLKPQLKQYPQVTLPSSSFLSMMRNGWPPRSGKISSRARNYKASGWHFHSAQGNQCPGSYHCSWRSLVESSTGPSLIR